MDVKNLDVFILTYNRATKLDVMLESLCIQTATGFNIIVVNNASTDNTIDIVNKWMNTCPDRNIKIITHKKNIGNYENFEYVHNYANNEYTAVFHDDDAIHPEYIETAMTLLKKHDAGMCTGVKSENYNIDAKNWDVLNKNYYLYPKNIGIILSLLLCRHTFQSVICKTNIYKTIPYNYKKYGKLYDIIFLYEMSQQATSILILGDCIRCGIQKDKDSNDLSTGPFPEETFNVIYRIHELTKDYTNRNVALWNFAYFLFTWSKLERFLEWKDFVDKLQDTIFSSEDIAFFNSPGINIVNNKQNQFVQLATDVLKIQQTWSSGRIV